MKRDELVSGLVNYGIQPSLSILPPIFLILHVIVEDYDNLFYRIILPFLFSTLFLFLKFDIMQDGFFSLTLILE